MSLLLSKNKKTRFEDLLDFHVMGKGFTWKSQDLEVDKKIAQDAWEFAKQVLASEAYQMVILDELTYLIKFGFIPEAEVVDVLAKRRDDLHVVVTGRDASQALINAADLVTEMIARKHPFNEGIKAQKGIEF
jgi:cob(I)alamin adenosyltransferase